MLTQSVDFVLSLLSKFPAIAIHNLEKARILKLIFWHLAVDGRQGCYIEFGVAQGNSLKAALFANKSAKSKIIGVHPIQRNFFGFDTFQGFSTNTTLDMHATWTGSKFNKNLSFVMRRFRKHPEVKLISVDVLNIKDNPDFSAKELKINNPAVILFDMDLYAPTAVALQWAETIIQQGTFLIFDEPFAFNGNSRMGEALAINEFQERNPRIKLRNFATYGAGGTVFIVDM
jgi:hypothetical protein